MLTIFKMYSRFVRLLHSERCTNCLPQRLCLIFFCSILVTTIDASLVVTVKAKPSNVVHIGDSVKLLCHLNGTFDRGYALTWRHGKKGSPIYGEQCEAFREGYEINCWPGGYNTATFFEFVIKSVKWSDRGLWSCALNFNGSTIDLKVQSPPQLTSFKPLPRRNGRIVDGAGTRTNPYNLLPANLTQFECSSGCGHPQPNIKWSFSNRTSSGSLNRLTTSTRASCTGEAQAGMSSSRSILSVKNCTEIGLYGHLRITCTLAGPQYRREQSRSFFVVCPDSEGETPGTSTSQPYGGVPALTLTHGEVIGIAVGCAMAIILTFLSIIWFHRKRLKTHRHTSV